MDQDDSSSLEITMNAHNDGWMDTKNDEWIYCFNLPRTTIPILSIRTLAFDLFPHVSIYHSPTTFANRIISLSFNLWNAGFLFAMGGMYYRIQYIV